MDGNIKWPRDGISIPLSAIDLHGTSSFTQGYDDMVIIRVGS